MPLLGLRDFHLQIQRAVADWDEQVRKYTVVINTTSESRVRRVDLSMSRERLNELHNGSLASLRRKNDRGKPAVT